MVLQLPAALCAARAAARVDHEGGLGGPGAKQTVHRMAAMIARAGLPSAASEGLASVMVGRASCACTCNVADSSW